LIIIIIIIIIKATNDGTAMSTALRLPKENLLFERLPDFARLSFWQQIRGLEL